MCFKQADSIYIHNRVRPGCLTLMEILEIQISVSSAIFVEDSGGPKESCIRWESRFTMGRGNFEGERGISL